MRPYRTQLSALLLLAGSFSLTPVAAQWQPLGPASGISTGTGSFQNIAKDAAGNLYVSFYDGSVTKGSVMKYDGTSWSYLGGSAGITTGTATYSSLAVGTSGDVYYCNQAGWPAAGINVRKFTSGSWTSLPDAETTTSNFQSMALDAANMPVIAYASGGNAKVKRYNGTGWDNLGTGLPAGMPYYIDLVIGSNDTAYVSWTGSSGVVVYKIHAAATATDTWTEAGTTGFSATSSEQFRSAMAIDATNNLYVAYTSPGAAGNKINVKKYNNGQWTQVGATNFSDYRVHYLHIAVNTAGVPYVAFSNFENSPNNKNTVMKFSGTQWELVGTAGISDGEAKWNALAFDNNNNPVIAYSDGGQTGGNMVKRFTTGACNNMLPANTVGSLGCATFNYKGQTVTYTTVRAADGNAWLQQNLGAPAVAASKTDAGAYGDYFQWGRWDDGHQSPTSATGAVPAVNNPSGLSTGNTTFFTGTGTAAWWSGGQLSDTWSASNAAAATTTQGADPCKAIGPGWRMPTQTEWAGVVSDEAITNPDQAFNSNLKLAVAGSRSSSSGNYDFVGTRGYYWSSTTSTTGGKYYYYSAAVNNPNAGNLRGGGASVRCLNITGNVNIVDSVAVNTLNNAAPVITTNGGTLQLTATVYPAIASQNVTWSIINGTGNAGISTTGLVTAQTNGTVWAKAVSITDNTKSDSIQLTLSNQVVPITSIDVATAGNVPPAIATNGGTLQMTATILPANAMQNVTWSIVPGTGTATISAAGLVTAQSNGTVWAKAVSVSDNTQKDSMMLTLSNQVVVLSSIDVRTAGNVAALINTAGGTLQMEALILPANASQDVTWSIIPDTGTAIISATGLVTAQTNGTVWAKAVSVANTAFRDSMQITISNQVIAVTGIDVRTAGNVSAQINVSGGTLQMQASVLPANASQEVTWSIVAGTGTATISSAGLVTAQSNGTVWAKAVSVANTAFRDSMQITISNQGNTTAISEIAQAIGFSVYPNPVQDALTLVIEKQHPALSIRISDLSGKIVFRKQVPANSLRLPQVLPLHTITPGIYLLELKGAGIRISHKIIKQ